MVKFALEQLGAMLLPSRTRQVSRREREERSFVTGSLVIILTDYQDQNFLLGKTVRIPRKWRLGEVVSTVTYTEGSEKSIPVTVQLLELPAYEPSKPSWGVWDQLQSNDIFPTTAPQEDDEGFDNHRILIRLSESSHHKFDWVKGDVVTVNAGIVCRATHNAWLRFMVDM